jgi:hypothetical protein
LLHLCEAEAVREILAGRRGDLAAKVPSAMSTVLTTRFAAIIVPLLNGATSTASIISP